MKLSLTWYRFCPADYVVYTVANQFQSCRQHDRPLRALVSVKANLHSRHLQFGFALKIFGKLAGTSVLIGSG